MRDALAARATVPATAGGELTVGPGETAALVQSGRVLGALGPGRHVLDPANVPFLASLGGGAAEVWFVTTTPVSGVRFGGPVGSVRDAEHGLAVEPRVSGEATIRVVDPTLAVQCAASATEADPGETLQAYAQYAVMQAAKITMAMAARTMPVAALLANADAERQLADATAAGAQGHLSRVGLEVVSLGSFSIALSDEDLARLGAAAAGAVEPRYEMLWDCKFCGTKKLLGLTHRHCPSCGAPQNAEERYFPSDAEKVPAQSHVFYGADVRCGSCGEANSKNSQHCGGCGAPLDGGKEVLRRQDQVVGEGASYAGQSAEDARHERLGPAGAPAKAAPPAKSALGTFLKVGGLVMLVLVALLVAGALWKKEGGFVVTGHTWKRDIAVERFGPVPDSAWCDQMPPGARGLTRRREVRSHEHVPDGEQCHTRKVDNGNGTFSEHQECSPKYRDEPVYDERCYYTIDRWKQARRATAEGSSVTDSPRWPDPGLSRAGSCEGCEREGARSETYTVKLKDQKGGEQSCDVDQQRWTGFTDGSTWKGEVRMIGGLDCASLRP